MKIRALIVIVLAVIVVFVVGLNSALKSRMDSQGYCAFCDQKVLARQTFYEGDLTLALYTRSPMLPGHSLIIPKRHVERFEELTDAEISDMGKTIKKVNNAVRKVFGTEAYLLLQKNGREVGQSVPHVHVHYIPRKAGDDSVLAFIFNMLVKNFMPKLSDEEMAKNVKMLQDAMEN